MTLPGIICPRKRLLILFAAILFALCPFAAEPFRPAARRAVKSVGDGRRAKRIVESRKGNRVRKTDLSAVYFTEPDRAYALAAERLAKTYLPLLAADMGLADAPEATIIIYPSKEDMYASIGYTPPATGSGAEPMGAYTSGVIAVLSPSCWADERDGPLIDAFISDGPVIHELAHFLLDMKTGGNYPEWFAEGCALYYESRYTGKENGGVTPAGTASYGELSGGFKYMDERESYRKSHEIVKFIAAAKGERGLKYIYERLEKGNRLEHTLKKLLGDGFYLFDAL